MQGDKAEIWMEHDLGGGAREYFWHRSKKGWVLNLPSTPDDAWAKLHDLSIQDTM